MATLESGSASKTAVRSVSKIIIVVASWATTVVALVLPLPAVGQASNESSPSSAMISPKSEGKAEGAIEPAKPRIAEDAEDSSISVDAASLLPELPPLPKTGATLVGGTIDKIDLVRDKLTVRIFGGGKESFLFDPRTQVYRGGKSATVADLHQGERVYLDTILDGNDVFARTIRLTGEHASGTTQGVVLRFQSDRGELTLRDALSPNPVEVRVSPSTKVVQGSRVLSTSAVVPGSLIAVSFNSAEGGRSTATEITILAQPGTPYTFSGQVVHIDLRTGLLVLNSLSDHKTYEVHLPPSISPDENLQPGAMVTVVTQFDGERYVVRNITFGTR